MIDVTAAGGAVYRKSSGKYEVLLIYRNGVWDLPKGTREKQESIEECARREVAEEAGIALPDIEFPLAQTVHSYEREGKKFKKTTHWFGMSSNAQQNFTPQKSEGIEAVEWGILGESLEKVGYENLKEVLNELGEKLQ